MQVEKRGRVGWLTLDRPHALNALNAQVILELSQSLDRFEADPEIGCIVLTGSRKAFAAGADILEAQNQMFPQTCVDNFLGEWDRIAHCRKPMIAAVAGYALGGGCEVAMMCDMIIAADNALFALPEISLGLIPGAGGTQRLSRWVGKAKAMDLCLTGRRIDAQEAERIGLVSRVVPVEDLLREAATVAQSIAARSLPSLLLLKECINRAYEIGLSEGLGFERRAFHSLFSTHDQKEGARAFAEKRAPVFQHR
ncbi:enoyl-CoA hydratase [Pseudomonas syringae]|uniref:enoyl-CoA hydratase n=1 Tax=Pseudomonas syringae TaxID=317 RepID=A0A085V8I9_PSESX|nr:enoyl-CoA hydratase [Pseudomonas syringae]